MLGEGGTRGGGGVVSGTDSGGGVVGREERGDGARAIGWAFGPVGARAQFFFLNKFRGK